MTGAELGRRRLLAAISAGAVGGLAGCGYRPGGGELAWTEGVTRGLHRGGEPAERWLADGEYLFRIRNRDGRTFDHDAGRWVEVEDALVSAYDASGDVAWSGAADDRFEGEPAVDEAGAYVPLADGRVTALERSGTSAGERRWTTDRLGSGLDLTAADGLIAATDEDRLVALGAESGDERFVARFEALPADGAAAVAVTADRLWLLDGDRTTIRAFSTDGAGRLDRRLPSAADWLATAGETVLVGVDGDLIAFDADGERFRLAVGTTGVPAVVDHRLYTVADGALVAIDAAAAEIEWERRLTVSDSQFVADGDGIYVYERGAGPDGCRFVAIATDGETRWSVPAYDELGCSGSLSLIGDRLVVRDGRRLYGFRREAGTRRTIL